MFLIILLVQCTWCLNNKVLLRSQWRRPTYRYPGVFNEIKHKSVKRFYVESYKTTDVAAVNLLQPLHIPSKLRTFNLSIRHDTAWRWRCNITSHLKTICYLKNAVTSQCSTFCFLIFRFRKRNDVRKNVAVARIPISGSLLPKPRENYWCATKRARYGYARPGSIEQCKNQMQVWKRAWYFSINDIFRLSRQFGFTVTQQ